MGGRGNEEDGEPFDEKMKRLSTTLRQQMEEGKKLDSAIDAEPEGAWVW